jgi:ABC-type nitrate/sulfonate/bicarbonate transport system substrate-binding protein/outer membrane protein OmpA-like peptidoglycan-associated protein
MKRAIAGILILLVAIGVGIGYKVLGPGRGTKAVGKAKGELVFATAERLTVSGVGGYQLSSVDFGEGPVPLIRIPLDTWGGYAALFAANGGAKPSKDSLFYKKGKFAVELVSEESASQQLSGYASGRYPIIWAPMDSLPVLYDALKGDRRIVPKVLGLFDWSSGGDGIIVKNTIKRPADLKDRVILTSSNSPFSFLLLWYLAQNGLNPQDVKVVWIDDGEKAFEAFKGDDRIVAWVSWTPFITDATDPASPNYVPDTRLLISSRDANQLIADTYVVRNDLLQDKPEMMTAFVEAMIEGSQSIDANAYRAMADFYKLPGGESDAKAMLRDVHVANWPESLMFFDADNQIGANKIFLLAQEYYKQAGALPENASYDPERVLTDSVIAKITAKGLFAGQKNRIANSFNEKAAFDIADLENQRVVLTNDVRLYFEAQRIDFDPSANTVEAKENMKQLALVAEQTKFLSTTIVKLIGHLDTAKVEEFRAKGKQEFIAASAQAKLLSKKRAEFVKKTLVERYKVDADRIVTEGRGWDEPLDASDPAKNRRVEVQFISLE